VDCFTHILDHLTLEEGKDIWLEKTPMHIRYIGFISKYVPDPHFVHIIRDGRDVVASIYDRAVKFPEKFGKQRNLDFAIQRWNRSLKISLRYIGNPNHTFVLYEQLVEQPDMILARVCEDIGVTHDPCMKETTDTARRVIPSHRQWLMDARESPHPKPSKFDQHFDRETREWISRKLKLSEFEKVKGAITYA
jgi:hypothetical protein